MAFQGTRPIRSKIVLENKVIQQLKHFSYLGCDISYDYDEDINNKVSKFQGICGTINRTLRNKVRKETQLKFYKVLAVPVILYGSESWILRRKDESKITAAEMRFLRSVEGVSRSDRIPNDEIRQRLEISAILDKINKNKENWKNHVNRMSPNRLPKQILSYNPTGTRSVGRPRKRWY